MGFPGIDRDKRISTSPDSQDVLNISSEAAPSSA